MEVEEGTIKATDTPIETFAQQVSCDYFHNEANGSIDNVRNTREMPKEDNALLNSLHDHHQRSFAETSRFLKGCVRFSSKDSK